MSEKNSAQEIVIGFAYFRNGWEERERERERDKVALLFIRIDLRVSVHVIRSCV